jgi:hypothetical protein
MDERTFQRLFQQAIGEAPVPPDLNVTARRALRRPARRGPSRLMEVLAAVASILLVGAIVGYNLLSHHRSTGSGTAPGSTTITTPTAIPTTVMPACTAGRLSLAAAGSEGAAGHLFLNLTLANSSAAPCTVSGFPTAQLFAPDGAAVPTRVVDRGGMLSNTPQPATFVLLPAQKATFQVSWGDVPVQDQPCAQASSLEIGPPGEAPSPALRLSNLSIAICNAGELDVSALSAPA